MKKRLIGVMAILCIVFSVMSIPVSAITDAPVTDNFEDSFTSGNQPNERGDYISSLFETVYIANLLEPCYSSTPTASGANAIAIEDGIGVGSSAGMRMTTTSKKSNNNVRPVYLYTKKFDITDGKELVFKERFKFNNVPANVNGRLVTLYLSDGVSKNENTIVKFNNYLIQNNAGNNSYRYFGNGINDIGTWLTIESRLSVSGASYTVDSYIMNDFGVVLFKDTNSGTAPSADYFKQVRFKTGTAEAYASNGVALDFEMVIDDCSVTPYNPASQASTATLLDTGNISKDTKKLMLTFDQAVKLDAGSEVKLYETGKPQNELSITIDTNNSTFNKFNITINDNLKSGSAYTLDISGIKNAGNLAVNNINFFTEGIAVICPENMIASNIISAGTYTFNIMNNDDTCTSTILAAIYENETTLLKAVILDKDIELTKATLVPTELVLDEAYSSVGFVKLFILRDLASIAPLCDAKIIN